MLPVLWPPDLPVMMSSFCLRKINRDFVRAEGTNAEMFCSICILTGTKTVWRRAGMTLRKAKTVLGLEKSAFISSWWQEEK